MPVRLRSDTQSHILSKVRQGAGADELITIPRRWEALSDTAIRPSVPTLSAQLTSAIGTLAACSLATFGLWTRPRTDVDPPRVKLSPVGGISSLRHRDDNFFKSIRYSWLHPRQGHRKWPNAEEILWGTGKTNIWRNRKFSTGFCFCAPSSYTERHHYFIARPLYFHWRSG